MSPRIGRTAANLALCWCATVGCATRVARAETTTTGTTTTAIDELSKERATTTMRRRRHLRRRRETDTPDGHYAAVTSGSLLSSSAPSDASRDDDGRRQHGAVAVPRMSDEEEYRPPIVFDWADEIAGAATTTAAPVPDSEEFTVSTSEFEPEAAATQLPPTPFDASYEEELSPAVIRGVVYEDANRNGRRDDPNEEPGLNGAVAKLFSCSTGARVGITRTSSGGSYRFVIPGPELLGTGGANVNANANDGRVRGCYYIQYNVDSHLLPDAEFTSPRNGETSDLYPAAGEEISNADAGAVGNATPQPTEYDWHTWNPTTASSSSSGGTTAAPSSAPSAALWVDTSPTPGMETIMSPPLPLPTETPAGVGGPWSAPSPADGVAASAGGPDEASAPEPTAALADADDGPLEATAEMGPVERQPTAAAIEPGDPLDVEASSETSIVVEEGDRFVANSVVEAASGTLYLNATVGITLDGLASAMDADAVSFFEGACAEFLNDQLQYATPPVYDARCEVGDQSVLEEDGRRSLRRLQDPVSSGGGGGGLGGTLAADVLVTGTTDTTPSIQRAEDVAFERLLAGTFTVQGHILAKMLKTSADDGDDEEEKGVGTTAATSDYFSNLGGVRGATANGAELSEGDVVDAEGSGSDVVLTKYIPAAVGGTLALALVLLLVAVGKNRRRNRAKKIRAPPGGGGARKTNDDGGVTSKKSAAVPPSAARPAPQTSPTNTSSTGPPSPESSSSSRVRRTIRAPAGKLGIMVANAKTPGRGPAVHTIRPGSPIEYLVHVNDVIVKVNGVDTRRCTAEEMTRLMKETSGEERRITLLSAHRH